LQCLNILLDLLVFWYFQHCVCIMVVTSPYRYVFQPLFHSLISDDELDLFSDIIIALRKMIRKNLSRMKEVHSSLSPRLRISQKTIVLTIAVNASLAVPWESAV
jgi:hypothetical protein